MGKRNGKEINLYDSKANVYKNPTLFGPTEHDYYSGNNHHHHLSKRKNHSYDGNLIHSKQPYYYDFTSTKKNEALDDPELHRMSRHARSASLSSLSSCDSNGQIRIRSRSVDPRPRPRSFFLGGGYYRQADSFPRSRSMDERYLDDPRVNLDNSSITSSSSSSSSTSTETPISQQSGPFYHPSRVSKSNKYKPLPDMVISPADDPHRVFRSPKAIQDPKVKYYDYQRKQKIYGVIQALADGKLPTNEQLLTFINQMRNSHYYKEYSGNLSADGKYLFNDWMEFLDIAYLMLQEKNKDESLQKFIYYSRLSSQTSLARNFYYPMVDYIKRKRDTRDSKTTKSEIKQAYTETFGIIQLLVSNNKFRDLISDINQLFKEVMVEVFNKTLSDSDEKIRYDRYRDGENSLKERNDEFDDKFDSSNHPFIRDNFKESEENDDNDYLASNQLNTNQDNNNFDNNDTSLRKRGNRGEGGSSSSSYQNVSIHDGMSTSPTQGKLNAENNPNPYQGMSIEREEHNEYVDDSRDFQIDQNHDEDEDTLYKTKYRASKYQYKTKRPISSGFSSSDPSNKDSSLQRSGSLDEMREKSGNNRRDSIVFKRISNSVQNIDINRVIGPDNTQRLDSIKRRLSEKVPSSKLKEMNRTFKSKFNKNVVYNILKRFQMIMSEIQKDDAYQNAISVLIKLSNDLIKNSTYIMKEAERSVNSTTNDYNTTESLRALKTIMENLAQGYSLNKLLLALGNVHEYIKNDKYKKEYARKINRYLYKVLKDPQYIQSEEYIDTGMELLDEGYLTFSKKYSHQDYFQSELENVLVESSQYIDSLVSDPLTKRFSDCLVQLSKDVFMNRNGKLAFKKDLFKDIITMTLPIVVQNIKYIPISRLEYEDSNFHLVMEDIFLSSDNFLPNLMEAKLKHSSIIGLRKSISSDFRNYITLNFYEIQADIRDVPFWYHKKKGFPKMTDWGIANFTIGGKGITIMTKFEICKNDPYRIIVPRKIECFVDNLNLEVNRSKYGILYSLGSSMINSKIRRQLIDNIRKNIFDTVDNVNEYLIKMRDSYKDEINIPWLKMMTL